MKNIYVRTIFGAIYIGSVILALLYNSWIYMLLFLFFNLACLNEFYSLGKKKDLQPARYSGLIFSLLLFTLTFAHAKYNIPKGYMTVTLIPLLFFPFIELYRKKSQPLLNLLYGWGGLVYITLPFVILNYLVFTETGEFTGDMLLGFFILLWTNDTGAYVFGLSFGKRRLFERLSPKKSWEGFIGGMISTLAGGWILSLFFEQLNRIEWIIFAALISIGAVFGDLIESMIKRELDIKDSGKFIPGHGGALDRFDSVLFAIPLIYVYLTLI